MYFEEKRKGEHKNRSYAFLCFMLFLLFILLRRKPNLRIIRTSMAIEQYLTSKRIESKTREQTVIHCDRNNVDDVIDVTISFAGLISFVNFCCQWHWYSHTHTHRTALRQSEFTMFRHLTKDGNGPCDCECVCVCSSVCAREMDETAENCNNTFCFFPFSLPSIGEEPVGRLSSNAI